jgi:hypothetical protein
MQNFRIIEHPANLPGLNSVTSRKILSSVHKVVTAASKDSDDQKPGAPPCRMDRARFAKGEFAGGIFIAARVEAVASFKIV